MVEVRGIKTAASATVAGIVATIAWMGAARAEAAPAREPAASSSTAAVTEQTSYVPPNRAILAGGIIAFTGSYVPSVIVAVANGNSFDNHLYIPLAGPWLDLSHRPGCGATQFDCTRESGFAALLIVDGVVQALGVLATGLAFVVPERRTRVVTASADRAGKAPREKPSVHIVPARLGADGYGVAAFGKF